MENNWKKHPRIFQLRASRYLKSFSILSSRQMIDLPIQVKACAKIQFWNEKVPIILVGQTTYLRLYMLQQHRTYHSKHSQPTSQLTTGLHPFHDGHSKMNSPSPLINTRMCLSINKKTWDKISTWKPCLYDSCEEEARAILQFQIYPSLPFLTPVWSKEDIYI
jgi:hypothetical protein